MSHTKGKWEAKKYPGDETIVIGKKTERGTFCEIAKIDWYGEDDAGSPENEANAERICLCVNGYDDFKRQRDDLLAACEAAFKNYPISDAADNGFSIVVQLRAAIEKTKENG